MYRGSTGIAHFLLSQSFPLLFIFQQQQVSFGFKQFVALPSLARVSLRLMKSVLTPLAKSVLIPLQLTAAASAADAAIQKKIWLSMSTLIISNENTKDIMEVVKYLEESGLLSTGVTKKTENEVKE